MRHLQVGRQLEKGGGSVGSFLEAARAGAGWASIHRQLGGGGGGGGEAVCTYHKGGFDICK